MRYIVGFLAVSLVAAPLSAAAQQAPDNTPDSSVGLDAKLSHSLDDILGTPASAPKKTTPKPLEKPTSSPALDAKFSKSLDDILGSSAGASAAPAKQGRATSLDDVFAAGSRSAGTISLEERQTQIGREYDSGTNGRTQDKTQAAAWFLKAAKAGYPPAMLSYSNYVSGDEKRRLVLGAAEAGYSPAMVTVFNSYLHGFEPFPQSDAEARRWAARYQEAEPVQGAQTVAVVEGEIQHRINDEIRRENERVAKKWQENRAHEQKAARLKEERSRERKRLNREREAEMAKLEEERERAERRRRNSYDDEDEVNVWQETLEHIQRTGDSIASDLNQVMDNTQAAYEHDRETQQRNERRAREEQERRQREIEAEYARRAEELNRQQQQADAEQRNSEERRRAAQEREAQDQQQADAARQAEQERAQEQIAQQQTPAVSQGESAATGADNAGGARQSQGQSEYAGLSFSLDNNEGGANTGDTANAGPEMAAARPEALAICKPGKNKPEFWWCDGPTQNLILADEPLRAQLDYAGCQNADPANQRLALGTDRYVFFCKYGIQDSDRNIASIYSLPAHILIKRKNYQCKKHQLKKCETIAVPGH